MTRTLLEPPTMEELQCLITWDQGTQGHLIESSVINSAVILCNLVGFGRFAQIVACIEDIWRHPEKRDQYLAFQQGMNDLRKLDKRLNRAEERSNDYPDDQEWKQEVIDLQQEHEALEKKIAAIQKDLKI